MMPDCGSLPARAATIIRRDPCLMLSLEFVNDSGASAGTGVLRLSKVARIFLRSRATFCVRQSFSIFSRTRSLLLKIGSPRKSLMDRRSGYGSAC